MPAVVDYDGWELNFDSAPFCNGSLHLGHVRNYVLGDVRARWLRSKGIKTVYASAYDTFGLPNELGARAAGVPPEEFVEAQICRIRLQMSRLALSYSSASLPCYSNPEVYRWTQWLFLRLWSAGLVYRRRRASFWCDGCESFLSQAQAHGEECWRCGATVVPRSAVHWYVRTSEYEERLYHSIDRLSGWSLRARRLLRSYMDWLASATINGTDADDATDARDWMVSRNRSWGTPLPAVNCRRCGLMPVEHTRLPVRLLEHGGDGRASCSGCGEFRALTGETLDCFFDDAWCFFGAVPRVAGQNPFEAWRDDPPSRVHLHAGFDSFAYLHYFRFVGHALRDLGYSRRPEPVDFYAGHDVVTCDGRKMSKNFGNTPDLDALLGDWGTDVVRLSTLVKTNPIKPIAWSLDRLPHARSIVRLAGRYIEKHTCCSTVPERVVCSELDRIEQFVAGYRIGAAIDALFTLTRRLLDDSNAVYETGESAVRKRITEMWSWFIPRTCDIVVAERTPAPIQSLRRPPAPTS